MKSGKVKLKRFKKELKSTMSKRLNLPQVKVKKVTFRKLIKSIGG